MRKTNMEKIKELAISFLYSEIHSTPVPFVAHHPFTNSWVTASVGNMKLLDLHKEEDRNTWRSSLEQLIQEEEKLMHLFFLFNKAYIMNFLRFAAEYMSDDDLGTILGGFWRNIEQIGIDESITSRKIVSLFKRASKDKLMSESDFSVFDSFPDEVTVYRGVGTLNKKKKRALSWTLDRGIAEWFARRFNDKNGEVWTITIPKELILCYFRNPEQEVIVDMLAYKGDLNKEKI